MTADETAELTAELTAERFVEELDGRRSAEELAKILRSFKTGAGEYAEGDTFIGVRMGAVFALAAAYQTMPLDQVEVLLDSPIHEARAGALRIMAKQAAATRSGDDDRRELFELYLRRHDRIDNWDLVDLAAHQVVGRYLEDQPRAVLSQLACSEVLWERRTAIIATLHLVRRGEVDDTFAIAELLLDDEEDLIHKATGGLLRAAGVVDRDRLLAFLDAHAATMPRTMLRYSIEHLDADQRAHYRSALGRVVVRRCT